MIKFVTGDILQSGADALVNTVNCVGIMGRGVALQFKNEFPDNFRAYVDACKRHEVQPGRMFVFETGMLEPKFIINFPTKRHWRGKSRIEDIESGLVALASEIHARGIRSIAVPPLGSGLGGLYWPDVKERIVAALVNVDDVHVTIYEPKGEPASTKSSKVPNMTAGRAALVALVNRYLLGLMDPFVTLIELQKLMYFLQEAGEPLRLTYTKGHYGPYTTMLSHVLNSIEGHLLTGYADGGDDPTKPLELVPGAINDAENFLQAHASTVARFDRVAALVAGFETPFGLELLASVHWVVTREGARGANEVTAKIHAWNPRKRKSFNSRQIALAFNTLLSEGWLSAA